MTFRQYKDINFKPDTLALIRQANIILDEYKGYEVTLRQLYYQFIARALIENTDTNYNKLGNIISDARMAGLVSWTAIADRTRYTRDHQTFEHPAEAMETLHESYKLDLWAEQPFRLLVGVEKDAMIGVISDICYELRVPFCSFRGYSSQSQQWRLGQQIAGWVRAGQTPLILHLGDHDPDGIDMTRDVTDRLAMFAGVPVNVQRLALNMPQIEKFKPPPNAVKSKSARYPAYAERFGEYSWELDALAPPVIKQLIEDAVFKVRDKAKWSAALAEEAEDRDRLERLAETLK